MTEPAAYLTFVVPPELVSGFRLAGVDTREAGDPDAAREILEALLREGGQGLVGVYSPHYAALDESTRERCERSVAPLMIPLPSGLDSHEDFSLQARVAALLERAVGFHVTFDDKAR